MKIHEVIDFRTKLSVHIISLINVLFLTFYTRIVCPFLNYVEFSELFRNLLILFIFQVFLREAMYLFVNTTKKRSLPRQLYLLSVLNWFIMGGAGSLFHELYYDPYPWHSHLKVISGYWILGGAISSQIEYYFFERSYKHNIKSISETTNFLDHIPRRITESSIIFTLAPSLAMLIMVIRYSIQDQLLDVAVVYEVVYISIFFLVICLITSYFYGLELKKDAVAITKAIKDVKEGILNTHLDESRPDELGIVSRGINEMVAGLQMREKIKEAFGRFVSPNIAEEFIQKYSRGDKNLRKGEKKSLVILMSDIRSFTDMSEKTPPEEITQMLNTYFNEMVAVIEKNGGIVDKFIGDAIMAIFGLLDSSAKNPSLNAVNAGLEMQKSLVKLNQGFKKPISIGIGIHYGEVVAGYLGSDNRLEYTVIGAPVNLASRIESETKDSYIPNMVFTQEISERIKREIPNKEVKKCHPKGIGRAISLYAVNEQINELTKADMKNSNNPKKENVVKGVNFTP